MADPKKYLSKIVKGSDTLWLKDAQAWADIEELRELIAGGTRWIDETTTPISNGSTTNPIMIDGKSYTAQAGDIVSYGNMEFIFSKSGVWREFGSTGSLKALAFKDSASGDYTPAGTNAASAVSFTGQTTDTFVTGFNDDAVAPTFSEGAFTPAKIQAGFYTAGTAPSFSEGAFTPAEIQAGFVTAGSAASYSHSGFSGGSLGAATTGNFNTDAEKSTYDEANETLTLSAASTGAAVTAQGDFTPAVYGTDTFDGGTPTAIDTTKFSGGSKAADTWNAGSMAAIDVTKFSGGSKAADTFSAGSAATPTTANAVTAVGTGTAAAQVFSGTQATITVE
jgi:hypothetical protein